ncbi:TPA: hypothetical protein DCE37_00765 [Candidatus Latescibacteria bacterium]|nr:hypothetical protein [Candidatus Latescibacterota bacterium]|tara:strand:- start:696 stop:1463 length:768 start_codon:yes stop_codon:yes gene_type:complete
MRLRLITCWALVAVVASCATTRYEEYGEPVEEIPVSSVKGAQESGTVPEASRQTLEAQIKTLEQRVQELEAALNGRLDQLNAWESQLVARLTALSEQVQELRRQLQIYRVPAKPVPPRPGPSSPTVSVNQVYEQALQAFDRQAYSKAKNLFSEILSRASTGPLADNAQYWMGECAYAVEDYTGALDAFKRVFQYTETEKDDDAQLKLGYAYLKLRDLDSALIEFKRLTVDYPQSEYVRRAEEQIRRIRAAKASTP